MKKLSKRGGEGQDTLSWAGILGGFFASVRVKRAGKGLILRELRVIQFIDALASVIVLQNTLIVAAEGSISQRMFCLIAVLSAAVFLSIFIIWSIHGLSQYRSTPGEK